MEKANFTEKLIGGLRCAPGKGQQLFWDGKTPGLGLRVTSAGAKAYVFETALHNRTLRITIGDPRTWSVRKAQGEATRLKTLTDQGIDPRELARNLVAANTARIAAEVAARREAEELRKFTLRALLDAYTRILEAKGKVKSAASTRSAFKCHVFGNEEIAQTPANQVTSRQVAALIRKVQEEGKVRTAGVLRSYLSAAFNAAKRAPFSTTLPAELIAFNVEKNPAEPVPAIAVARGTRRLSVAELKAYLLCLGDGLADTALRLALLSGGQRMAQVLRAKVADYDSTLETLRLFDPKGKRNTPREHLLPLAPNAAALVAGLVKRATDRKALSLFAVRVDQVNGETLMANETPGKRAAEICVAIGGEPFNLRDIRRTCETMLAGMEIHKDVRAQLLSHGLSGVQSTNYDLHDYMAEKRAALAAWEAYLHKITSEPTGDGVVPMQSTESSA